MRPIYIYLLLIVIGIPWWWRPEDTTMMLGMPAWVISSIGVSILASVYTAYLLSRPWPTSEADFSANAQAKKRK